MDWSQIPTTSRFHGRLPEDEGDPRDSAACNNDDGWSDDDALAVAGDEAYEAEIERSMNDD